MGLLIDAARAATALNTVLLAMLTYVWARNYLQFRSKHTLGLSVFAILLLAENALAFYYYMLDPDLSVWFSTAVPDIAWNAMLSLHLLEFGALVFLTWVTWD